MFALFSAHRCVIHDTTVHYASVADDSNDYDLDHLNFPIFLVYFAFYYYNKNGEHFPSWISVIAASSKISPNDYDAKCITSDA